MGMGVLALEDFLLGARIQTLKAVLIERVVFLNKLIGILENHSESLSLLYSSKNKEGWKKRERVRMILQNANNFIPKAWA